MVTLYRVTNRLMRHSRKLPRRYHSAFLLSTRALRRTRYHTGWKRHWFGGHYF